MKAFGYELRKAGENDRALKESFDKVRYDLDVHKKWLSYLHAKTDELHSHADKVYDTHTQHRKEISEYASNITGWVNYLYKSQLKLEKDIKAIEGNIRLMLKEDIRKYHDELIAMLKSDFISNSAQVKAIRKEIVEEMKALIEQKIQAKSDNEGVQLTIRQESSLSMTPPEIDLVTILFNENSPMTYEDLARKTGKSINSIRVYMNSLKSKKDIVEEFRKPSGEKIFSVKNKEKVKTLFNVH
jgi:hypothetical protein